MVIGTTLQRDPVRPAVAPGSGRRLRPGRLLGLAVAAILVVVLGAVGTVVHQARQYDSRRSDAILVLGASQYWGKPSPVFANRLDYAARLFHEGVADQVITVGGRIPGDRTTEAQAGAEYLTARGVPAAAIVAVPTGRDTIGSLQAVARLKGSRGWDSLTLVSDRTHLARSAAVADSLGFDARVNGPAAGDGATISAEDVAREAAGLLRFAVFDRWTLADRS
jgi:uncharacterized SAM-binding protein YcdF (DUF218 family)